MKMSGKSLIISCCPPIILPNKKKSVKDLIDEMREELKQERQSKKKAKVNKPLPKVARAGINARRAMGNEANKPNKRQKNLKRGK